MPPAFVFDSGGANRSLELMGKHIGMFTDKIDLNAREPHPEDMPNSSTMTPREKELRRR